MDVSAYYTADKPTDGSAEAGYLYTIKNYIRYYYRYAEIYKCWYLCLSILKFLVLAAIPVSQTIDSLKSFPWITASASSLCILLESVTELFQMKDKWILYRQSGNELLREEREYVTGANRYCGLNEKERFGKFVENAENIISNEASKWNRMFQSSKNGEMEHKA